VTVLVLAKQPLPGRVKTRLCPPLTAEGAAQVAAAALKDTLDVVRAVSVRRRVLVLDGVYGADGVEVVAQRPGPMPARLAGAFDDAGDGPTLLVGMDTPQLDAALLTSACAALDGSAAVLGPACDGGWWALGLQHPDGALLSGVPTSRDDTGARQLAALRAAGLDVELLPALRDVDTIEDAAAVAALAPRGRFARVLATCLGAA